MTTSQTRSSVIPRPARLSTAATSTRSKWSAMLLTKLAGPDISVNRRPSSAGDGPSSRTGQTWPDHARLMAKPWEPRHIAAKVRARLLDMSSNRIKPFRKSKGGEWTAARKARYVELVGLDGAAGTAPPCGRGGAGEGRRPRDRLPDAAPPAVRDDTCAEAFRIRCEKIADSQPLPEYSLSIGRDGRHKLVTLFATPLGPAERRGASGQW